MKYMVVIALVSALFACGGASSNETVKAAEVAFHNIKEARTMLASINSIEDAKAIEAKFSEVGLSYIEATQTMRTSYKGDQETDKELAKITPLITAEYQGMLLELNALQARNSSASQVILDELRSFKPQR